MLKAVRASHGGNMKKKNINSFSSEAIYKIIEMNFAELTEFAHNNVTKCWNLENFDEDLERSLVEIRDIQDEKSFGYPDYWDGIKVFVSQDREVYLYHYRDTKYCVDLPREDFYWEKLMTSRESWMKRRAKARAKRDPHRYEKLSMVRS